MNEEMVECLVQHLVAILSANTGGTPPTRVVFEEIGGQLIHRIVQSNRPEDGHLVPSGSRQDTKIFTPRREVVLRFLQDDLGLDRAQAEDVVERVGVAP